jgi:hypothetical protein
MVSPFDFVKSVTETKEDIYDGNESSYNPYLINKALSFNVDCVFISSEMNKYPDIPKSAQYLFLLNSIEKKRRHGKWIKKDTISDDIALIKEAYGYSNEKAIAAMSLLTDKQLLYLKDKLNKGGRR